MTVILGFRAIKRPHHQFFYKGALPEIIACTRSQITKPINIEFKQSYLKSIIYSKLYIIYKKKPVVALAKLVKVKC